MLLVFLLYVMSVKGYQYAAAQLSCFVDEELSSKFLSELFTYDRFIIFKGFVWAVTILGFLFCVRLWSFMPKFVTYVFHFFEVLWSKVKGLKGHWLALSGTERTVFVGFVIALIGMRVYYLLSFPLMEDEAFSYTHFVDKGFFVTSSYYPGPNNHVFYNQLAWTMSWFSDDPFWIMKLPTFIFGLIVPIVMCFFLLKHFNFTISMMTTLLFSFSLNVTVYSVIGRGYMLMILLMMIMIIAMINIIRENDIKFYNGVFVMTAVLGFYTVPVFLYPFVSIVVFAFNFGLFRRGVNVKWIVIDTFWVGVWTLILYSPILVMNGFGAVVSNDWVRPTMSYGEFFSSLPEYFASVSNWLWDVERGGIYISLVVFGFSIYALMNRIKTSKWFWFYMIVSVSLMPIFILIIQKVQPAERIWTYFSFFQYLFLSIAFYGLSKLLFKNNVLRKVVSVVLTLGAISWFTYRIDKDRKAVVTVYKELEEVIYYCKSNNYKSILTDNSTAHVILPLSNIDTRYDGENKIIDLIGGQLILSDKYLEEREGLLEKEFGHYKLYGTMVKAGTNY